MDAHHAAEVFLGHDSGDDSDDALTVWEYLCKCWGQRARQDEEDEATLAELMRRWVLQKQQKKEEAMVQKQGTRDEASKKLRQREAKRAAYMEELGKEEGDRLYKEEQAEGRKHARWKAKRKKARKKKPKKQKDAERQCPKNDHQKAA